MLQNNTKILYLNARCFPLPVAHKSSISALMNIAMPAELLSLTLLDTFTLQKKVFDKLDKMNV